MKKIVNGIVLRPSGKRAELYRFRNPDWYGERSDSFIFNGKEEARRAAYVLLEWAGEKWGGDGSEAGE